MLEAAIQNLDVDANMGAYFQRTQGKPWKNYKSVIALKGIVATDRALPAIIEG